MSTITGLAQMSPLFEGRRPPKIQAPPSGNEIKKLRERLTKYGAEGERLTPQACEFLAAAVTSPGAIRQQLSRPTIRPTATGHLEVIYATVPLDCLAPDPTNGRVVGATSWPASDQEEGQTLKLWAPADLSVHPNSPAEVLIRSDSLKTIKRIIEDAAEDTKRLNPEMRGKIQRDGILDPLLCQLAHVETLDGQRGVALITRDGSTRCSYALETHRSAAHAAFFGPTRDVERRRQRWLEMRRRGERSIEEVTEEELVELRTFLVDVQIVVGFHTDDPQITALHVVDDIVRRTHVETTHPWRPVAQSNSEADRVLGALRGEWLTENEFLLFGGKLPRAQRSERGLPVEPDAVVAELMQRLGATETRRGQLDELHSHIRSVDSRGAIRTKYKAQLVGALGLRQFTVEAALRDTAHATLAEALTVEDLWELGWENTDRSPEQLRGIAHEELIRDDGSPGPACRELLVKAAGHLVARGWLKRETRAPYEDFRDQRSVDKVLDLMHRRLQGIEVLGEALAAGRRGADARALNEDGEVIELAAGDVKRMSNPWIRKTFMEDADHVDELSALPPVDAKTPREQVALHMRRLESWIRSAEGEIENAERVANHDGGLFLERRGWIQSESATLAQRLTALAGKLNRYGVISEINLDLPPQMTLAPVVEEHEVPEEWAA